MKLKHVLFGFYSLFFISNETFAQQINAGTSDTGVYYFDYAPDLNYQAKASDPTHLYPQGYLYIDIDRDGNTDFILETTSGGTSQTGWCYARLNCIDAGASIMSHYESSLVSPNTYDSLLVPDQLSLNSTINNQSGNYIHAAAYVWSTPFGSYTGPWVTSWNNTVDKYIGLKLNSNGNTMYAWLHITLSFTNNVFSLTLHDFACTKNPLVDYSVPLNNSIAELNYNSSLVCFPNPSRTMLMIETSDKEQLNSITIVDVQANVVVYEQVNSNKAILNIESLSRGAYIARIRTHSGTREKIFIKE